MHKIYKFDDIVINVRTKKKPEDSDKLHYIGLEHIEPGVFEFSRWGSDITPKGEKLIMKKGDVLFGKRRAYQKKVAIAPFDGIFSAHGMVLRPKEDVICKEYFPFFISSNQFMDTAMRISVGGLSPTINWKDLQRQEFELPPIEEQRVLADKLWSAYNLKESYKKMIVATDALVKAQFVEMFDKKCNMICLDDLSSDWLKGQPFRKDDIIKNGARYCIHYGELFTKYGVFIKKTISMTNIEAKRSSTIGDILFPASDVTPKGLARCSVIMMDNVVLGGDIIIMKPKKGINPMYLGYAINNQTEQLLNRVTGSVVRHLSARSLKSVLVPIPPESKQNKFIEIAQQAETTKLELTKTIDKIDRVIKSLLQ